VQQAFVMDQVVDPVQQLILFQTVAKSQAP
jgi:hypothetical protein